MGVSFETCLRRRGDALIGHHCYVLLRRRHDVPIRCRGDVPLRRLGDVPRKLRRVFHLRRNCDVLSPGGKVLNKRMGKLEMEYEPFIPTIFLNLILCIRFRRELLMLRMR